MALDFLLFAVVMGVGAWATRERDKRICVERQLAGERALTETLGLALAQARTRQEAAERALAALGDGPAPRSEQRIRRIK